MVDDRLEALRAEVARARGPARARPLTELGRELSMAYWRAGPGRPGTERFLHEAITVLGEAYGHLEAGEALRAQTAALWGWLLGTRHLAHGGSVDDREEGIRLLDESLESRLPPIAGMMARLVLGQLLVSRPLGGLHTAGLDLRRVLAGAGAHDADLARALTCFRSVADDPVTPAQGVEMARMMIGLTEVVQTLTGGLTGAGGMPDLGRMMTTLAGLQDIQSRATNLGHGNGGAMPNPFDLAGDVLAGMDPLDRPVVVVDGVPAAAMRMPDGTRSTAAPERRPVADRRAAVCEVVAVGSVSEVVDLLLDPDRPLDAATLDRLVARAEILVDGPDLTDADHVLYAAVLLKRAVAEGDGWEEAAGPSLVDLRAVADSLAAVDPVRAAAPVVVDAVRLAERLAEHAPDLAVASGPAARLSAVGADLRAAGVDGLLFGPPRGGLLYRTATADFVPFAPDSAPARVVVVGDQTVPTAASPSTVFSVVPGAGQAVALTRRRRRNPTEAAVFVSNPRQDRDQASIDAMLLRRTFYPESIGLGHTVENDHGAGTAGDVRARLDASVLHLGCGITPTGSLELAGSSVLTTAEIAAATSAGDGGVAVLPPDPQGAAPLIDALLAAGFAGAVAFAAPLPAEVASLVYALLHAELVDRGQEPARAVHAVRCWLRDPGRALPDDLPTWYYTMSTGSDAAGAEAAEAIYWFGV